MQSMFKRMSKMHLIIQACEEPRRFTELKESIGLSDAGLTKHLNSLQKLGWLTKTGDGSYVLTDAGRRLVPTAQRAATVLDDFKRAPQRVEGVSIDYIGLEGREAKELLDAVSDSVQRLLGKHPAKHFGVMINFRPPR
jgi:DNA-binding HxlR family transcriptional regulator